MHENSFQVIKQFGEHSIETDLIKPGDICIDAGCLGFEFSKAMRDLGMKVFAYDLTEMTPPAGINYNQCAIATQSGVVGMVMQRDRQAYSVTSKEKLLVAPDPKLQMYVPVDAVDINSLYHYHRVMANNIGVLKLDIEGSEYLILSSDKFQPEPKQITLEFHEHAAPVLHAMYFDKCIENLSKHYSPIRHERYEAHGCGFNYWDDLWLRKDLL